jgi:hypothetical protein
VLGILGVLILDFLSKWEVPPGTATCTCATSVGWIQSGLPWSKIKMGPAPVCIMYNININLVQFFMRAVDNALLRPNKRRNFLSC